MRKECWSWKPLGEVQKNLVGPASSWDIRCVPNPTCEAPFLTSELPPSPQHDVFAQISFYGTLSSACLVAFIYISLYLINTFDLLLNKSQYISNLPPTAEFDNGFSVQHRPLLPHGSARNDGTGSGRLHHCPIATTATIHRSKTISKRWQ